MSLSLNYPTIRPSLLLDFAADGRLDPRITFTRATPGTYYDGVTTAKAEQNLFLQSQEFNSASWSLFFGTITANNAVAPDGTTTADTLNPTAQFASVAQTITLIAGQPCTVSIWIRRATGSNQMTIYLVSGAFTNALLTFTPTSTWTRYSVTFTPAASETGAFYFQDRNLTGWTAWEMWGAQIEQRSSVTAYTPTTTQPITNYIPVLLTAPAGQARFEHDPTTGESLGLEIEEARTNLLTYSEQFNDAAWSGKLNITIFTNDIIAPDGALTGDKLVANAGSSVKYIDRAVTIAASTTHTFSAYMKAGEYTTATIYAISPTAPFENFSANVNLSTGAVSNITAGNGGTVVTATATSVGNGWWRVALTGGVGTKTTVNPRIYPNISTEFTGNGYSGIYIWGAQLEAGSFLTSYIATVATTQTRNADDAVMTGTNFSSWFNNGQGTMYSEAVYNGLPTPGVRNRTTWALIGPGNIWNLWWETTNTLSLLVYDGAAYPATISTATISLGATAKSASAYALNNVGVSTNGASAVVDTSCIVPSVIQLTIGNLGNNFLCGTVKKLAYYPTRLPDAQLQALTRS
jgi:hypothetical protein